MLAVARTSLISSLKPSTFCSPYGCLSARMKSDVFNSSALFCNVKFNPTKYRSFTSSCQPLPHRDSRSFFSTPSVIQSSAPCLCHKCGVKYRWTWISASKYYATKSRSKSSKHSQGDRELAFTNHNKNYLFRVYAALCFFTPLITAVTAHICWKYLVLGLPLPTQDSNNPILTMDSPVPFAVLGSCFNLGLHASSLYLLSHAFTDIYYNPTTESFTGVRYTWRLGRDEVTFRAGDVQQLESAGGGGFAEVRGNFRIHGRVYFLSMRDFKSPRYYNIMMGYRIQNQ